MKEEEELEEVRVEAGRCLSSPELSQGWKVWLPWAPGGCHPVGAMEAEEASPSQGVMATRGGGGGGALGRVGGWREAMVGGDAGAGHSSSEPGSLLI